MNVQIPNNDVLFYVARHGETVWNAIKRIQGQLSYYVAETKPTTIPAWYYVDTLRKAESAYTLMPPKRTASLPQRSEYAIKADNDLVARNRYQTKWVLPSFPGLVKA